MEIDWHYELESWESWIEGASKNKLKRPTTRDFKKLFVVVELYPKANDWIKVNDNDGWQLARDFEVINENR